MHYLTLQVLLLFEILRVQISSLRSKRADFAGDKLKWLVRYMIFFSDEARFRSLRLRESIHSFVLLLYRLIQLFLNQNLLIIFLLARDRVCVWVPLLHIYKWTLLWNLTRVRSVYTFIPLGCFYSISWLGIIYVGICKLWTPVVFHTIC